MKTSESDQDENTLHKLSYNPPQSYLEMARAIFVDGQIRIHHSREGDASQADMTCNMVFALLAHTYIFSYMAINAFVTERLARIWQEPNSLLKAKYTDAKEFADLLNVRGKLSQLNNCINELCCQLQLTPLHTDDPKLWKNLLEVVKLRRDFLTHPKPDPEKFDKIIGDAINKDSWEFPSRVAEDVIGYFYASQKDREPDWLRKNREFRFEGIRALSR